MCFIKDLENIQPEEKDLKACSLKDRIGGHAA